MPVTDHIRNKLSQVPHKPGVYLHKDRFGTVIYIGKARDLRNRVSQYFHSSRRQGWDLKFNALVEAIHDFDVHVVKSEPESLLLESKLIKEFKPRFNIDLRDDKNFLLLKVNLADPIPRFTLTRLRKDDGGVYFGPFVHGGSVRRAVIMMRKKFQLRGCRPLTPNESDYKHCLYGNLKHCTAPCIGNVTREQYLEQVRAGIEFLQGQTDELRAELEAEMKKAAQLRDALQDMARTVQKTAKFERIPYTLPVSIHPEADVLELGRLLGLAKSPERIEGFDISNISGTFMVASMVSFWHGRPDRSNYRRFKMKTVTEQNDFACMAETVRRRYSRLKKEVFGTGEQAGKWAGGKVGKGERDHERQEVPETCDAQSPQPTFPPAHLPDTLTAPPAAPNLPDLILIDGGKGQLGAACEELAKLGLSHIPIIGFAKEYEEIFRPGEPEPLRLDHSSGALKLLQRVRDESHRFANTYNAQLRIKKISESILDEFPGIGDARKKELLRKFGSIQRLRLATVEQIGKVSGFGGEMAAKLKEFLDARNESRPPG